MFGKPVTEIRTIDFSSDFPSLLPSFASVRCQKTLLIEMNMDYQKII